MEPVNDIIDNQDGMWSTGSDPYMLLHPTVGTFPVGDCEFVFRALPGTVPLLPVLYLDMGTGFNEAQSIRLRGGEAGIHRSVVELPTGLQRLRFDPTTLVGAIPMANPYLVARQGSELPLERDYAAWLQRYHRLSDDDIDEIRQHIQSWRAPPAIDVHIASGPGSQRTVESLKQQLYPHWRAELPCGKVAASTDRRWARGSDATHTLLLQAGDVLPPHALYRLAATLLAHPDAVMLTMDDDTLDSPNGQHSNPRFYGAWSPDLERNAGLARRVVLQTQKPSIESYSLDTMLPDAIHHVPGVIVSRSVSAPLAKSCRQVVSSSRPTPLVSIIVPTRDHGAMLRQTLAGVLERTAYKLIEVIVLDNGSLDEATHDYFEELKSDARVQVVSAPGPFNYALLNNTGVAAARGEVVVLLNNDMDVIHEDWLAEMVSHALRPEVGAVGCKLLYADGSVQHAGIVTGLTGLAGHLFRGLDGTAPGYLALAARTRNVSAVTGACLAIRRSLYLEIGGLDDRDLAVSYNDVDLCLRLRQAGYLIVWTPFATLHHLESATRGLDSRAENASRAQREHDTLLRRWGKALLHDPYYSPCLALDVEDCRLAWPPAIPSPWRDWSDGCDIQSRSGIADRTTQLIERFRKFVSWRKTGQ